MIKLYIVLMIEYDAEMVFSVGFLKYMQFETGLLLYDKASLIYDDVLPIFFSGQNPSEMDCNRVIKLRSLHFTE